MGKHTQQSLEKLSASLKKKWASGTRKPNPPETYVKSSATRKQGIAEGRIVIKGGWTSETAKEAQRKVDIYKLTQINREHARQRIGSRNPPGPSCRGPGHWKSKFWVVKDPNNRTRIFINLSEFIRSNSNMFDAKDVIWKKSSCGASKRIAQLFAKKKAPNSWKGWRALTQEELDRESDFIEEQKIKLRQSLL